MHKETRDELIRILDLAADLASSATINGARRLDKRMVDEKMIELGKLASKLASDAAMIRRGDKRVTQSRAVPQQPKAVRREE